MKSNKTYLAFDTETGGINPKENPILTAYFAVLSDDYSVLDELELKIRPSAPYSKVEAEALSTNGIDMRKHEVDPETLDREDAARKLKDFLKKHKGKGRYDKPIPLGHNISFDIKMITEQLLTQEEWEQNVSYAVRDTKPVCDFLKDFGLLPPEIGKLDSLVRHFNIKQLKAHVAKDDVLMTVEAYKKLGEMVRGLGESSGLSLDVLDILEK